MKIGIITFQYANNYGALFQAYALSRFLQKSGHDVFILDYKSTNKENKPIEKKRQITIRRALDKMFRTIYRKHQQIFYPLFDEFRLKYLCLTEKQYNLKELEKEFPEADAYICGSDQIWNTDYFSFSKAYLLSFLPNQIKRIAYAPSFGNEVLNKDYISLFKEELNKFTAISVREKSGCDIIKDQLNFDAEHVIDPTLLQNDYDEITDFSLVPEKPYLLVYRLHQDPDLTKVSTKMIKQIANQLNIDVFTVSPNSLYLHYENGIQIRPNPAQLLGLIKKSRFFCTNSFHGTVFAIFFQKEFVVFPRDKYKNKQNLRLIELLLNTNLIARYFDNLQTDFKEDIIKNEIHWENVYLKLNELQEKSRKFLNKAIS